MSAPLIFELIFEGVTDMARSVCVGSSAEPRKNVKKIIKNGMVIAMATAAIIKAIRRFGESVADP